MNLNSTTTIDLDGYIDEYVLWGDEITPDMLKTHLAANPGDITFRLNSYGGSCNAGVRMYDMLREHPGSVTVRISGAACSAASFFALGADHVEMTPGSQYMIHDPSMVAWGQEKELGAALNLLRSTKESIINIYARKTNTSREDLSGMMTAETWLDAESALKAGFIDRITGDEVSGSAPTNAAKARAPIDRAEATRKVNAWLERRLPSNRKPPEPTCPTENTQPPQDPPPQSDPPSAGVFVANRLKLLLLEE